MYLFLGFFFQNKNKNNSSQSFIKYIPSCGKDMPLRKIEIKIESFTIPHSKIDGWNASILMRHFV